MIDLKVSIIGAERVQARFLLGIKESRRKVEDEVKRLGIMLLNKVKSEKLSGQVLNVKTGRLRRSINMKFTSSANSASASVGTNLVYARIHEFGGQTRAHIIKPKNGRALLIPNPKFAGPQQGLTVKTQSGRYRHNAANKAAASGELAFFRVVHHPGSKIPMRSYLLSSLGEMRSTIQARLLSVARGL
jgi:phage gpG-like protein